MLLFACRSSRQVGPVGTVKPFQFFTTNDTINLKVIDFVRNRAYCYSSAGIPYALVIGETTKSNQGKIPNVVSVLAKCDNKDYTIGQNIRVVPVEDPTGTNLKPIYITRDTVIGGQTVLHLSGSEYPAIWGKILVPK